MNAVQEGPWRLGLNSVDSPCDLPAGQYQWAVNCINKGGSMSTRPGQIDLRVTTQSDGFLHNTPRGMKIFTPRDGVPELVVAAGGSGNANVYHLKYPFTANWQPISSAPGVPILFSDSPIEMEVAVIGVIEDADGNITAVDPYPVLMIGDGTTRTAYWDGVVARHLNPDPDGPRETPPARWMKWVGNRLWVVKDRKLRASNLLNPIKFTEESILSEGGYFNLPGEGTGLGVTPDYRSLLAFTEHTTSSIQAGIINRAAWSSTPDFQKVIFPNIGCAAGRSIVNQYGMTWWYSHGGLINLDNALQAYRSSEIKFKDASMRRSRANFADDVSGICATAFENYLLISVPSGDLHNYHTWVMDENPNESVDSPAQWSSVWTGTRPVQFASGIIQGKPRCFSLSQDYPATGDTNITSSNVWEMFLQDKRDMGSGAVAAPTVAKNISSGFETRFIPTGSLAEIKYIELDLEEVIGTVQLSLYYATRRGTYKLFGTKQIVGTVGSVTASMTLPVTFSQYLPQRRIVKSVNESILASDANAATETTQTRNVDKYFSFLVLWTGQMSVAKMRIHFDPLPEQYDGLSEDNETTDRYIRPDGTGAILSTGPVALPIFSTQSQFISTITPRWSEPIYQAMT